MAKFKLWDLTEKTFVVVEGLFYRAKPLNMLAKKRTRIYTVKATEDKLATF